VDDVPLAKPAVVDDARPVQPNSHAEGPLPPLVEPEAAGSRGWKLWNESTTTRPIVDAIDGAQKVVNVEFFGISDGGKGAHVVDALERAATRGVEVNVFADSISWTALPIGSFKRLQDRIEAAGGEVHTNLRVPVIGNVEPARKNVDHRKVVTIDGTTAFTGGVNYMKVEDDYKDSMVELHGVDAARVAADQLDRWRRVGGTVTPQHEASVRDALKGASLIPTDPNEMRVVKNAPEEKDYALSDSYRELIKGAKQRVWVSSPGYSDQELVGLLNDAAKRGVDVRLVAPGKNPLGIPVINWVGYSHLRELIGYGAKAYAIPEVLHRKGLVVDDEVVFSSMNVVGRSKTKLHEFGVRTKDPEFVAAVAKTLTDDMERGTPVAAEGHGFGKVFGDFMAQKVKITY
jgi:cardiolipin synthase